MDSDPVQLNTVDQAFGDISSTFNGQPVSSSGGSGAEGLAELAKLAGLSGITVSTQQQNSTNSHNSSRNHNHFSWTTPSG